MTAVALPVLCMSAAAVSSDGNSTQHIQANQFMLYSYWGRSLYWLPAVIGWGTRFKVMSSRMYCGQVAWFACCCCCWRSVTVLHPQPHLQLPRGIIGALLEASLCSRSLQSAQHLLMRTVPCAVMALQLSRRRKPSKADSIRHWRCRVSYSAIALLRAYLKPLRCCRTVKRKQVQN
jgi:hypothetical protein